MVYGYGYHQSDITPTNRELYGFPGDDGAVTDMEVDPTRTTVTISYISDYLSKHRVAYGELSVSENVTTLTDFESGANSIELTSLTCATEYVYVVGSIDADGNSWPSAQDSFTTDACASSGGGSGSRRTDREVVTTTSYITAIQRATTILTSAGQTVPQALYDVLRALGGSDQAVHQQCSLQTYSSAQKVLKYYYFRNS